MTNNRRTEDPRHSHENPSPPPPAPPTKKHALLLQRKRPPAAPQHEPWLFQSLNFQHSHSHSLPALPPASSSTSSATNPSIGISASSFSSSVQPASPLSAFAADIDAPFFLDAASLKRLLPSAPTSAFSSRFRPKSSGGGVYGSGHQNNNRPQNSGRRSHHRQLVVHAPARLEALAGPASARRKSHKRKSAAALQNASTRKYALRMDGVKGRVAQKRHIGEEATATETQLESSSDPSHTSHDRHHRHHHHHEKASRRTSYDEALAYNSDDEEDAVAADPAVALEDLDEARRQRMVIAAQLNLTIDEYEALDAAFGGQGRSNVSGEYDDNDNGNDGSMTSRYFAIFTQYDVDRSGAISPDELRKLLTASGEDMDDAELAVVIQQADTDRDGEIDFDEFIGLMRARKRLLRVANHMGVAGTGPASDCSGPSSSFSQSMSSSLSPASNSPLPPLKMATLQSKKHLQQFSSHFTRPTPTCLRPGAQVDLTQLRRELAISEFGIQELNSKVREGLHWVQQHCPVRSLRAQIFCHRWGMEKVQQLFLRLQSQALSRAFHKWRAFRMYERNKLKANLFLKCKASQKVTEVMTKWRRKVTRRRFAKWKTECVIDARNELHCAAIELQRVLRGKSARLELRRLREHAAATTIQALVRGRLARLLAQRIRRAKLEHECASLLQRCYRGYTGKRVARALFQAQREALAAMKIQRAFRNHQRRELLRVIQQTKLEHDCALRLQCCIRGYLARRERSRRVLQKKRIQCATTIQRRTRGLLARRRVAEMRRREAAAATIQTRFRVFRSRMRVHLMRREKAFLVQRVRETAAATQIQARWRCFHTRKLFIDERLQRIEAQRVEKLLRLTSAMTIQAAFRGYQARRVVQRARFEKLKWMNLTLMNRSALQIQSFWRGYHGRLASHLRLQVKRALEHEENEAAKRIQLIARCQIARGEKRKMLEQREQCRLLQQKRANAALLIQKVARGKRARRAAARLQQEHRSEARNALDRLVAQTKRRAAVKIQCCVRRFLSRCRYLTKQRDAQRRKQLAETRLVHEKAALVIQCAMRRARAQRLLRQRRHEFERRISMMASEKAHDEIARLRKEQEAELLKLKLQLMHQQSTANEEATKLREQVERQREEEQQRRAVEADELAQLKMQTLLHQQQESEKRVLELQKTQEAGRLRETLEREKQAQAHMEALTRIQENEEIARLKLAALLESSAQSQKQQQEVGSLQGEAKRLQDAALAMRTDQARMTIRAACLKYIARRRIEKLQHAQARQLASLKDEEERVRLKAVQEKEIALARLKAVMDEENRARDQEIKALEMQMLERARVEKERIAKRNAAARSIQSLARGYLGRQRVKAIQDKIENEREARASAMEAMLAEAEAKVAEVLADDGDAAAADDAARTDEIGDADEWVEYWDENAQASYFYNIRTQEASWTRPMSASSVSAAAMDIVRAVTAPSVDHEQDSYANYDAETVDENGYPLPATGAEAYADQYGYYDQSGQYHYYEADPAAAGYAGAQMAGAAYAGMYPGLASAYAYQAAMASMMFGFGNPMMQQFANPMMQQYANSMAAASTAQTAVATDAANAAEEEAAATAAAPPDPWEKFFDQYTGAAYYYNNITGEKYWA